MRGIFLAGNETIAVEFEEKDSDDEPGALIAVDEGMVADYPSGIDRRHVDHICGFGIGKMLLWPRQCRSQQTNIPKTGRTAMQGEQSIVQGKRVPLLNPDRLFHLARTCNVLR